MALNTAFEQYDTKGWDCVPPLAGEDVDWVRAFVARDFEDKMQRAHMTGAGGTLWTQRGSRICISCIHRGIQAGQ